MSFFKAVPPSRLKEFLTNVLGKSFLGTGLAKPRIFLKFKILLRFEAFARRIFKSHYLLTILDNQNIRLIFLHEGKLWKI